MVSVFPGAANAPLHRADQAGLFTSRGVDVEIQETRSSQQQLEYWDAGRLSVMHTSPDHLVREHRRIRPLIVRTETVGELSLWVREDGKHDLRSTLWAVDGPVSGFALVLRALLEDVVGLPVDSSQLQPVGGTKQRFEALIEGRVNGTALHPPFDAMAKQAGFQRLAGHFQLLPDLITLCTVVPAEDWDGVTMRAYVDACDEATRQLLEGGEDLACHTLDRAGWDSEAAAAGASWLLGASGLRMRGVPSARGLSSVVELRRRFDPAWLPACDPMDLLDGAGRASMEHRSDVAVGGQNCDRPDI